MRGRVDEAAVRDLARQLAREARAPVTVYLRGGASAVLEGWRTSTLDVDLRLDPDTDDLLRALPRIKEHLGINIELASPPDFVPELPGWRERSPFVLAEGHVTVRNFDFYSQALSKIERGFEQDLSDVRAMVAGGLVDLERLRALFAGVQDQLFRYPAIDPDRLRAKLADAV